MKPNTYLNPNIRLMLKKDGKLVEATDEQNSQYFKAIQKAISVLGKKGGSVDMSAEKYLT